MSDAQWVATATKQTLSPLGEKVATMLGIAYAGIYHLSHRQILRTDWTSETFISISILDGIASWDACNLTYLVILAHEMCLRLEIRSSAPGYLKLCFSPRERKGNVSHCHPTIEETVNMVRQSLPIYLEKDK